MWLLCWLWGHRWFNTVVTHHDAQEWVRRDLDDDFYRGVWHERICTRCQTEEAVYQNTLYSGFPGNIYGYDFTFKPIEHFPYPGDWGGRNS